MSARAIVVLISTSNGNQIGSLWLILSYVKRSDFATVLANLLRPHPNPRGKGQGEGDFSFTA